MGLTYMLVTSPAVAQVTPDLSLGLESSRVTPNVTIQGAIADRIDGGAPRGRHLFHSFSDFNIDQGQRVYFANPPGIETIFSRVTGGNGSTIQGVLGVDGGADLFFLNPNGILFGPNARLDLQGSFVGTTAASVQFADGQQFGVSPEHASSLLTLSLPIGLQFGQTSGGIVNQSVNDVERNVFDGSGLDAMGNPTITNSPAGLTVKPGNTLALVGGPVEFISGRATAQGGRIELGSVGRNSLVSLTSITQGWSFGYADVITFDDITLRRTAPNAEQGTAIDVSDGGRANIQGRHISLLEGSQLVSFALENSMTDAGEITLIAAKELKVRDFGSFITSQVGVAPMSTASGNGGDILIQAQSFLVENGGVISSGSNGPGNAGELNITASFVQVVGVGNNGFLPSLLTTATGGLGEGGPIHIQTNQLVIRDGGQLFASTFGPGPSGTITIDARESILVNGSATTLFGTVPSTIATSSASSIFEALRVGAPQPNGTSGELTLTTKALTVQDGAEISAFSLGAGMGGTLNITAETLRLNQGNLTAATTISNGGIIKLQISGLLELANGSQITATAGGQGNGGNLTLNSGVILAIPGTDSDITAATAQGQGGTININTQGIFGLTEQPALPNNGTNDIDASSDFGVDGTIVINTPETNLNAGLVELPIAVAFPRLAQGCRSSLNAQSGRFVSTGRGGLSPNPTQPLSSNDLWRDVQLPPQLNNGRSTGPSPSSPTPIKEAKGWLVNKQGQIQFITATAAASAAQRCPALSESES